MRMENRGYRWFHADWKPNMLSRFTSKVASLPGGGEGYFQKNWVEVCGMLPETLNHPQTKICDFPYPISNQYLISDLPYNQFPRSDQC